MGVEFGPFIEEEVANECQDFFKHSIDFGKIVVQHMTPEEREMGDAWCKSIHNAMVEKDCNLVTGLYAILVLAASFTRKVLENYDETRLNEFDSDKKPPLVN